MLLRKIYMPIFLVGTALLSTILFGTPASYGHGYITPNESSELISRAALKENNNRGNIQYEPQSVEGPKGFPQAGPPDGKIASANNSLAFNLDEQTASRWVKNNVSPGNLNVAWTYTAPNKSTKWHYYLTQTNWNPNSPLNRSELEHIKTVQHDGTMPPTNATHTVTIPQDRTGYHILLGVWDVADTTNAFYQVIDLDVNSTPNKKLNPSQTAPRGTFTPETNLICANEEDPVHNITNLDHEHELEKTNKSEIPSRSATPKTTPTSSPSLNANQIPFCPSTDHSIAHETNTNSAIPTDEEEDSYSLASTGGNLFWPGFLLALFATLALPLGLQLFTAHKLRKTA